MYNLAVLHQTLYEQVHQQTALADVEFLCLDNNLSDFVYHISYHRPDVIVVDLSLLGNYPVRTLHEFKRISAAQMIMVSYAFARWNIIEQLNAEGVHLIKSPLNLQILQTHLNELRIEQDNKHTLAEGNVVHLQTKPTTFAQLDHPSSDSVNNSVTKCECINHLNDIVMSLAEFEKYTQGCVNNSPEDAAIHEMLRQEARKARSIMEAALEKLTEHEKQQFSQACSVSA